MTNCIIIDDEPRNVSILEKLIQSYCPHVTVTGSADNAVSAIQAIRKLRPQLVFLDIEMPGGNAFDLLDKLMPVAFEVIFVTAFDHYAVKAFRYSALDYLLKPIDIDDLQLAIEKAGKRPREQDINQRLEHFIGHVSNKHSFSKIALRTKDGLLFYAFEEILYCVAAGAYTRFTFTGGESLLVTGSLLSFENTLPAEIFCRVHDANLINLNYIKKYYNGKGGYVEMTDGKTIEVSSRKRAEFLNRIRS